MNIQKHHYNIKVTKYLKENCYKNNHKLHEKISKLA